MVIFVPLTSTARRAPSSSAARVRFIALPARDRVPVSRTGAAEAIGGGAAGRAVERNSVSNSGSAIARTLTPATAASAATRATEPRTVTDEADVTDVAFG